jgi:hypothetical protein
MPETGLKEGYTTRNWSAREAELLAKAYSVQTQRGQHVRGKKQFFEDVAADYNDRISKGDDGESYYVSLLFPQRIAEVGWKSLKLLQKPRRWGGAPLNQSTTSSQS